MTSADYEPLGLELGGTCAAYDKVGIEWQVQPSQTGAKSFQGVTVCRLEGGVIVAGRDYGG